jgi:uncharacterized repeat protein (TIGR01451 family)
VNGAVGARGTSGTDGATGTQGTSGSTGAQGVAGLMGARGLVGATGLRGEAGAGGPAGQVGSGGPAGTPGQNGKDGSAAFTAPADPIGVEISVPVAKTTTLCVTNTPSDRNVRRGGLVTWTIVVRNCGEHAASAVSVSDRLRKGASLKTRGGGTLVRGRLEWTIRTLAVGARRTYRVVTRIARHVRMGTFTNHVTVDAKNTESAIGRGSTTVGA